MAFTVPVFEIDGDSGHAAMYFVDPANTDDRSPITAPMSNLGRLMWHTAFDYLEVVLDETVTVTIPARTNYAGFTAGNNSLHTPFSQWPVGAETMCFVLRNDKLFGAVYETQRAVLNQGGNTNHLIAQVVAPVISNGTLQFIEGYYSPDVASNFNGSGSWITGTMPAVSFTARCVVMRTSIADRVDKVDINPAANELGFGFGKFDPARKTYIKAVSAGTAGAQRLMSGPSIDMTTAGIREWLPDGSQFNLGSYGGSYSGPETTWVKPT